MSNWMMSPARISNHNLWWRPIKQIGLSNAQEKMSGASLILSLSTLQWSFFSFLFLFVKKLFKCLELFYLSTSKLEKARNAFLHHPWWKGEDVSSQVSWGIVWDIWRVLFRICEGKKPFGKRLGQDQLAAPPLGYCSLGHFLLAGDGKEGASPGPTLSYTLRGGRVLSDPYWKKDTFFCTLAIAKVT